MKRRSILMLMLLLGCQTGQPLGGPGAPSRSRGGPGGLRAEPLEVREGRLFLHVTTDTGQPLVFLLSTAGKTFLRASAARRLHLPVRKEKAGGVASESVPWPYLAPESPLPLEPSPGTRLPVLADSAVPPFSGMEKVDGVLGWSWFSGRAFTFGSRRKQLILREPGWISPVESHRVPLGQTTGTVPVKIGDETLLFAIDTGATIHLSRAASAALNDGSPPVRATSYIGRRQYDAWRAKHPDWRVIEDADVIRPGEELIEVPQIELAGHAVGPVWFTTRLDDALPPDVGGTPVTGTLGGSALRWFEVTLDYPRLNAAFEFTGE